MTVETTPDLPPRLENIQALRGVAAMFVLFYHLAVFLRQGVFAGSSHFPAGPWDQGWAGVDLFFVISGFIMVWTTRHIGPSLSAAGDFLWRRATRIYPLWWVCAGIMAVYFLLAYGMPAAPDRVSGMNEAWGFALKSFILWPQDVPPLLGLGWTLIHEMWFYVVFAAILLLPRRLLIPALSIWGVAILAHYGVRGAIDPARPVWKLVTSPLTLEFIGGALVACALLKMTMLKRSMGWAVFGVAVIWIGITMIFNIRFTAEDHHFTRMIVYGLPMMALVFGSTALSLHGGLSVPNWLVRLGDWSYALYLIHFIVLIALKRMLALTGLSEFESTMTGVFLFSLAAITIILLASWALHSYFEKPLIRFFRRRKARSPAQKSA